MESGWSSRHPDRLRLARLSLSASALELTDLSLGQSERSRLLSFLSPLKALLGRLTK